MTFQVRLIGAQPDQSSFHYVPGDNITPQRAAEIVAMHASAQCVSYDYAEVRDDAYPAAGQPPVFVADRDALATCLALSAQG